MHAYLATVLRNHDCETMIVGGVADHVHALFALSRNYSIATIVREIKRTSSSWVKELSPRLGKFHWQNEYGAFSVSQSELGRVITYIEKQEQHHRESRFRTSFARFSRSMKLSTTSVMYGTNLFMNPFRVHLD